MRWKIIGCVIFLLLIRTITNAQVGVIKGQITLEGQESDLISVTLSPLQFGALTDKAGRFVIEHIPEGTYQLESHSVGYERFKQTIYIKDDDTIILNINLKSVNNILDEVIITSTSKTMLIRENPIAVSLISNTAIEHASESNIVDVLVGETTGLSAVKTGPNISKPFIRGLGYNRVLTLYDGIRQEGQQWGDEHGLEVDDYNIYRAEVIKGPASLMYGSDALAGVVSLFPYIPDITDGRIHGNITNEYQTNNGLIGNALRLSYNNGKFVYSLSGSHRMARNYRNPVDGRVYLTNFEETNFSGLAGLQSAKGHTYLNFTLYHNRQGIPDGSRDSVSRKFTKQILEGDFDTPSDRPQVSEKELNSYKVPALSQRIQHYRMYLHSSYTVGKGNVDVMLAGQQNIRQEYNHPLSLDQAGMYVYLNSLNYGIRYALPEFSNIEINVGTNGMTQTNRNKDATDFPIPDYNLVDFGTYVFTKWKKSGWTVSGGIRYDLREERWKDFYIKNDPVTGFDRHVAAGTEGSELPFPKFQKTFQDISASIGATYSFTPNISFKANAGRAFRAPNITELASNGLDPGAHIIYLGDRTFNPEVSLEEDMGLIVNFKNLSGEISLFNNDINDFIYLNAVTDEMGNQVKDAQGNRTYRYQQTKARLYGIEGWVSIHPVSLPDLKFETNFSFTRGLNRSGEFKGKGIEGEYLPLIPPFVLNARSSYIFQVKKSPVKSITPKVGVEVHAAQNKFFALNDTESRTSSYELFNIGFVSMVRYSENYDFSFQIQVNNIFDKAYQNHLSRLKYFEDYADGHGIFDMGRNVSFKLIFPF